ncbi:MAG: cytochrome c [Acidobacteriota bacterium]
MTRSPARLLLAVATAALLVPSIVAEDIENTPSVDSAEAPTSAQVEMPVVQDATRAVPVDSLPAGASARALRGQYLVEAVGQCGQCHTPRDGRGNLRVDEWLQGAVVPVSTPAGFVQQWVHKAPRIAGLPQHTDEEFVLLMTTGVNRDGIPTRLPMPQFRLTEDDALAIAAYLRELGN